MNVKIIPYLAAFILGLISCGNSKYKAIENMQRNFSYEIIEYAVDTVHARGIAIANDKIYTANSNGMVYSYNLETKKSTTLTDLAHIELRDIVVLNDSSFIAMQSDAESVLIQDFGSERSIWKPKTPTFFDGIDINKNGFGILMGDPIENVLQVYFTSDFGKSWTKNSSKELKCVNGEAGFAASGTTVQCLDDSTFVFVSGGQASHLFKTKNHGKSWFKSEIPFKKSEASGSFSTYFWNDKHGIVVGGDYTQENDTVNNCFYTNDGGISWEKPNKTTKGYRSCVLYENEVLYACGTTGIDFSLDFGHNWYELSKLNTLSMKSFEGKIYVTASKGKMYVFKAF